MAQIHNQRQHLQKRRQLRAQMPPAEVRLWKRLQNSQVVGAKFRRQHGFEHYVLDFYCPEVRLALELDGESHGSEMAVVYDAHRQRLIESDRIHFLRFSNQQVYEQLDGVVETIRCRIEELRTSTEPGR